MQRIVICITIMMCEKCKVMDAESALKWCEAANDWVKFSGQALTAAESVNISFLSKAKLNSIDEAHTYIDWR